MNGSAWAWSLFAIYLVGTAWLAWRGGRRTHGPASFAIGDGRMNPWMAGMALGACLASSSLFVIMPGQVYEDGLPALLGFTIPLIGGIGLGLFVFARPFQRFGKELQALTLPHWLGGRYGSRAVRRAFASICVLQVAYLVLVVVGCSEVMQQAFGVPRVWSVVGIVVFVFAYTGSGGAWAHAMTNSLQGVLMLVVAVVIFGSGWSYWMDGSLVADLRATGTIARGSKIFGSATEIWLVQFVVAFGLAAQPQLLIKALYVERRRDVVVMVVTAMSVFLVYALVLFSGAYARLALGAGVRADSVVATYLQSAFAAEWLTAFVTVAIVSASMSTIDGLLVAITSTVGGDLLPGKPSVRTNRLILLVLAVATVALSIEDHDYVLLFSQAGVFGLVAASVGPLVAGLATRRPLRPAVALVSGATGLACHFVVGNSGLTENPGVGASIGIVAGIAVAMIMARP